MTEKMNAFGGESKEKKSTKKRSTQRFIGEKLIYTMEGKYSFYDDPNTADLKSLREDKFIKIHGLLSVNKAAGFHRCNKSALWDDMTDYADEVQDEEKLSADSKYIVCYYEYVDGDLAHQVDYDITRDQIVANVRDQKYVEGTDYFKTSQLKPLK